MTVDTRRAVIQELVKRLRRLMRALQLDASKMSRRYGLTGAQTAVLREIHNNGPLSSADLSRKLFVTPSNVTGVIDRLVKKELVERIPRTRDRRVVRIHMTQKGRAVVEILPEPTERKLLTGLSQMDTADLERLSETARRLLDVIDAGPDSGGRGGLADPAAPAGRPPAA